MANRRIFRALFAWYAGKPGAFAKLRQYRLAHGRRLTKSKWVTYHLLYPREPNRPVLPSVS